jgi:circadian clock protein KaiB
MGATFKFRLYIAGSSPNSTQAVVNLNALCQEHLLDRHEIEIVDVLREPKRALADGILITPMLVKRAPTPACQVFGNLSQPQLLRHAIGL